MNNRRRLFSGIENRRRFCLSNATGDGGEEREQDLLFLCR
jgi:hypothetical protein